MWSYFQHLNIRNILPHTSPLALFSSSSVPFFSTHQALFPSQQWCQDGGGIMWFWSLPVWDRGHFFLRVLLGNDRTYSYLALIPLDCLPKVLPPAWHLVAKNIEHSESQEEKQAGTWEPLGAKVLMYYFESSRHVGVLVAYTSFSVLPHLCSVFYTQPRSLRLWASHWENCGLQDDLPPPSTFLHPVTEMTHYSSLFIFFLPSILLICHLLSLLCFNP